MGAASFSIPGLDVSRETIARLEQLAELVVRWNPAINLVAAASVPEIMTRHIADSAQIVPLAPASPTSWVDVGAGGGFPGLVVAAILAETSPRTTVTLVESDRRKAAFLLTAAQAMGLRPVIRDERIEALEPQGADVLSARALAPLDRLLGLTSRHIAPDGIALFLKGRNVAAEIADARRTWRFDLAISPSLTDSDARILRIGGIAHA